MIPYYGFPASGPDTVAVAMATGAHGFVSKTHSKQVQHVIELCQSFALDNGAFSAWLKGEPITDWQPYYKWAAELKRVPSCDFAVIPDVIDGTEADNDALVEEWPLARWFGAPVWHMHESFDRLERLAAEWPRICIGSSGDYAKLKTPSWWHRISQAMRVVCDDNGQPVCKLHGLRMLDPAVFTKLPLASADSTNIGRNVGLDTRWKGTYAPPTREARVAVMRSRTEAHNAPPVWTFDTPEEPVAELFELE